MKRAKRGKRYWFIDQDNGCFYVDYAIESGSLTDERNFLNKNYFTTKKLAEATVRKFNVVLSEVHQSVHIQL